MGYAIEDEKKFVRKMVIVVLYMVYIDEAYQSSFDEQSIGNVGRGC